MFFTPFGLKRVLYSKAIFQQLFKAIQLIGAYQFAHLEHCRGHSEIFFIMTITWHTSTHATFSVNSDLKNSCKQLNSCFQKFSCDVY